MFLFLFLILCVFFICFQETEINFSDRFKVNIPSSFLPSSLSLSLSPSFSVGLRLLGKKENMVLLPCLCFLFVKLDGWDNNDDRAMWLLGAVFVWPYFLLCSAASIPQVPSILCCCFFSFVIINLYYCCFMLCCVR